jgi:hypothetical protein
MTGLAQPHTSTAPTEEWVRISGTAPNNVRLSGGIRSLSTYLEPSQRRDSASESANDAGALVRDYLLRLNAASTSLPSAERFQLVAGVAARIDELRWNQPGNTVAYVRALLEQVGRPELIAHRAMPGQRRIIEARRRRAVVKVGLLMIGLGVIACAAALFLAFTRV